MTPRMAFLGMGGMGRTIARRLALKGGLDAPILIWNRTHAAAEEAVSETDNSEIALSLAEAVDQADIIWSCVSDAAAVQDIYAKVLENDLSDKLFVECSSIPGKVTETLAEDVCAAGATMIAMPVFGDPSLADKGMLICMPCGPKSSIESIRPFLMGVCVVCAYVATLFPCYLLTEPRIAKAVVELDDIKLGNAMTAKLIGNVLILSAVQSVAEALTLAEKADVGTTNMAKLIATLFPLPPHSNYLERMMSTGFHEGKAMVSLELARKMGGTVTALAEEAGASVPAYLVAVEHLRKAEDALGSRADITAIYAAVRQDSGLSLRNNG